MYAGEHILTVTRAAAIAGVEPRSVNDAIERGVLPPGLWRGEERRRRLAFEGCLALSFYYHAQNALTAELRRHVLSRYFRDLEAASAHRFGKDDHHRKVVETLKVHRDSLRLDHHFPRERFRYEAAFLVVDLYPFFEKVNAAAADLEAAEEMVTVDPGVVGGTAHPRHANPRPRRRGVRAGRHPRGRDPGGLPRPLGAGRPARGDLRQGPSAARQAARREGRLARCAALAPERGEAWWRRGVTPRFSSRATRATSAARPATRARLGSTAGCRNTTASVCLVGPANGTDLRLQKALFGAVLEHIKGSADARWSSTACWTRPRRRRRA